MQRRKFIQQSALGLASGLILPGIWPDKTEKENRVKYAMGWLLWRDFGVREITLKEAINNLSDLGASGIEFTPRQGELQKEGFTTASLREYLAERNMQVSGHYFSAPFYDETKKQEILDSFRLTISSLKAFGAKNIIIGPPGVPENADPEDLIRKSGKMLDFLGQQALDEGVEIGIHPHLNTIIETPDEIHLAMNSTNPKYVFMSPDTGHIYLGGGNVVEILRTYKDRINYFHFKDGERPFVRPDFNPNMREMGKGGLDFPEVMQMLKEIKYKGWINIEQDFTDKTPHESAEISFNYVNEKLNPIYN